jgi:hypothetical protein
MMPLKAFAIAVVSSLAWATVCLAGAANLSPESGLLVHVDWQYPPQLPPQFRNHCTYENFTGRPYCSNHCGIGYQFFYCSEASFGCCRLGHGYCDWNGFLRCAP